jgi:hypothetical protein
MRNQMTRQKDLFEETVPEALVSEEMQAELVTQLALLMFALIDVIEAEARDEQDRSTTIARASCANTGLPIAHADLAGQMRRLSMTTWVAPALAIIVPDSSAYWWHFAAAKWVPYSASKPRVLRATVVTGTRFWNSAVL